MSDFETRPGGHSRRHGLHAMLGLVLASLVTGLHAQDRSPNITEADLEQARRIQPRITDADMARAASEHSPPAAWIDAGPSGTSTAPGVRIDALPRPAPTPPIDLEALARGYAATPGSGPAVLPVAAGPSLLVFMSMSMPVPSIRKLLEQAARARASVYIRGFADGSLRETVARLQPLIGQLPVAVQIDPQAFDRYAVTTVPSVVLVHDSTTLAPCANGVCPGVGDYLRASGDVSLDYALRWMQGRAPAFRRDISTFLGWLRG